MRFFKMSQKLVLKVDLGETLLRLLRMRRVLWERINSYCIRWTVLIGGGNGLWWEMKFEDLLEELVVVRYERKTLASGFVDAADA